MSILNKASSFGNITINNDYNPEDWTEEKIGEPITYYRKSNKTFCVKVNSRSLTLPPLKLTIKRASSNIPIVLTINKNAPQFSYAIYDDVTYVSLQADGVYDTTTTYSPIFVSLWDSTVYNTQVIPSTNKIIDIQTSNTDTSVPKDMCLKGCLNSLYKDEKGYITDYFPDFYKSSPYPFYLYPVFAAEVNLSLYNKGEDLMFFNTLAKTNYNFFKKAGYPKQVFNLKLFNTQKHFILDAQKLPSFGLVDDVYMTEDLYRNLLKTIFNNLTIIYPSLSYSSYVFTNSFNDISSDKEYFDISDILLNITFKGNVLSSAPQASFVNFLTKTKNIKFKLNFLEEVPAGSIDISLSNKDNVYFDLSESKCVPSAFSTIATKSSNTIIYCSDNILELWKEKDTAYKNNYKPLSEWPF